MEGRGEEGEKEAGGSGEDWGGSPHTALLSCKLGHLPLACFPPAAPVASQTAQQVAWGSWALRLAELSWAGQPGSVQEACSGQAGQSV